MMQSLPRTPIRGLHRGQRKHRGDRFGKAPRFREGRLLGSSTTAIKTSFRPQFFSSFMTPAFENEGRLLSQNLAPSVCSI